ncbi:hypothetical protein [Mobiluncus curtisii]|uniref:hypothetical protein n=1 Tax=Mobiluncus curtisii TaxID=2051 RepID=UPI0020939686|nr:hypothetical protein [Mobiluncus curtisii]
MSGYLRLRGDYTFCENLQPRIADRVIGPSGRKIADALAQQWLDYPQLKYLNQRFHPRAQHLRLILWMP